MQSLYIAYEVRKALKSEIIAVTLLVTTILTTQQLEVQADNDNDPNPYCDTEKGKAAAVCHDRKDNSETTGLYTCNDETHKADWRDCKDATTTDSDD